LRYGFVDIATERAAKLAVESMNGSAIDGYNLDVRMSERPVAAKKPRAGGGGAPQRAPHHRVMPRPSDGYGDGYDERQGTFTPRPQPRKQPTFQVERRSLPRRPG
jgi:RNA recognition motif-containing protein